jgi:mycothiol synthase
VSELTPQQSAQVLQLAAACTTADGRPALSEQTLLHARYGEPAPGRSGWVLVETGAPEAGVLLGVAHWDAAEEILEATPSADTPAVDAGRGTGSSPRSTRSVTGDWAVAPWARGDPNQPSLVLAALLAGLRRTAPPGVAVDVWVHGASTWSAQALNSWEAQPDGDAAEVRPGLRLVRTLWQMRRPLTGPDVDLDAVPVPSPDQILVLTTPHARDLGVLVGASGEAPIPHLQVRTFRVGEDESPWLQVNTRAFATHPEQGRWTADDLAARQREDWFDPAGFFVAERVSEPSAPARMVGFHWTKVHAPAEVGSSSAQEQTPGELSAGLGEVYVLGVDPSEQGSGLGRALARVGLAYLRQRGLPTAILYVEADNQPAVHLYTSLGFVHHDTDQMYRLV